LDGGEVGKGVRRGAGGCGGEVWLRLRWGGVSWEVKKTFNWKRGIEVEDVKSYAIKNVSQAEKN